MAEPDAPPAGNSTGSLRGMRVLLVEDTWIIAQSYADLLVPLGIYVIGPAVNVSEATRLMAGASIDAALVDMNLQGEMANGLVDALHQRGVPTIIITGYEVIGAIGEKANAVLKKPIRAEQLIKTLRGIATGVRPPV